MPILIKIDTKLETFFTNAMCKERNKNALIKMYLIHVLELPISMQKYEKINQKLNL